MVAAVVKSDDEPWSSNRDTKEVTLLVVHVIAKGLPATTTELDIGAVNANWA